MSYDQCFSKQAAAYAKYRPRYPEALAEFLASVAPGKKLAWDCGTGNGQVALPLAERFDAVTATDVNADQLRHAFAHPKIAYRVARAEASGLQSATVDLVTVGNALHWFELDLFYSEVKRVLRPGGIVAVFQYGFQNLGLAIDAILLPFETEFLKAYWTDRNQIAMAGYGGLAFPFERLAAPKYHQHLRWDLSELQGFVSSWSAVQKYKDQKGSDPFLEIRDRLATVWGDPTEKRAVAWELELHVGRHRQSGDG